MPKTKKCNTEIEKTLFQKLAQERAEDDLVWETRINDSGVLKRKDPKLSTVGSLFLDKTFGKGSDNLIEEDLAQIWSYLTALEARLVWKLAKKILSERQLQCFYLRFMYQLSESKIGFILGISQCLVHRSIANGINKIKKCLSNEGGVDEG